MNCPTSDPRSPRSPELGSSLRCARLTPAVPRSFGQLKMSSENDSSDWNAATGQASEQSFSARRSRRHLSLICVFVPANRRWRNLTVLTVSSESTFGARHTSTPRSSRTYCESSASACCSTSSTSSVAGARARVGARTRVGARIRAGDRARAGARARKGRTEARGVRAQKRDDDRARPLLARPLHHRATSTTSLPPDGDFC